MGRNILPFARRATFHEAGKGLEGLGGAFYGFEGAEVVLEKTG